MPIKLLLVLGLGDKLAYIVLVGHLDCIQRKNSGLGRVICLETYAETVDHPNTGIYAQKLPCIRVRPFLGHNLAVYSILVGVSAAVAELVDAQR